MKKTLLIIAITCMTSIQTTQAQNVVIPDANFKAYLVGNTAINTNMDTEIQVTEAISFTGDILCSGLSISDLTGLEQFTSLNGINCSSNTISSIVLLPLSTTWVNCASNIGITNIDLSLHSNLNWFRGNDCNLNNLNVANGNNTSFASFYAYNNPSLTCIQVDNAAYSTTNWTSIDLTTSFSENCSSVGLTGLTLNNAVAVYPNPTTGAIFLASNYNITLTDVTGKIIVQKQNTNSVDISNQPTGMYFILLTDNKGQVIHRSKLTKE